MKYLRLVFRVLVLLLILWCPAAPAAAGEAPVSPIVQEALRSTGVADFLVVLRDDPGPRLLAAAAGIADRQARRAAIIAHLKEATFRSQNDLGLWLLRQGADYQHFWIVNQVLVRNGTPALLTAIKARQDVRRIDANPRVQLKLPESQGRPAPAAPSGVEWNISKINADQVWAQYGVRGAGVVVGVQDTGVKWDHEALQNQYRGWNGSGADHTYSWHDAIHSATGNPCGVNTTAPCDDYGHGTHVTGIIAGYTLANQIGVAPGAKWIACRNMDQSVGTPATYLECFQWFLEPGGDASKAPQIISNSWSCPPEEGCAPDTLEETVNTVVAAGILVVASNGNEGPGCITTKDPPAIYRQSFSAGATDSSDNLASFSSRGPVNYGGQTYVKPDISAPGVGVRSSYYLSASSYTSMSGTSMAAPHVAGAAALLWSGIPRLRGKVDLTRMVLETTARPHDYTACGDPAGVPNNGYGWGIVDVLAAFQRARPGAIGPEMLLLLD